MKKIIERLKSPVVIAQLITIIGSIVVTVLPECSDTVDKIVYSLTIIVNVFAGVNDPTSRDKF